jgi:acyl carrier protein
MKEVSSSERSNNENKGERITESVIEIIRNIIKNNSVEITENSMIDELGIDSILYIRIIVDCEDRFEVEFEYSKLKITAFVTISEISEYIRNLYEAKTSILASTS